MTRIILAGAFAAVLVASANLAGQSAWKAPRTPWGDPDISGLVHHGR